jgi:hypothetical protein
MKQQSGEGREFRSASFSIHPRLLEQAKIRAGGQKRNLSNYIQVLIEEDLRREKDQQKEEAA